MWFVTQYVDVAAVLKEARVSKNVSCLLPPDLVTPLERAMLFQNPPDHTRLRSVVGQTFTPVRVRDLEPRIAHVVDTLIAQALPKGGMDFIADFALPLPVIVIAHLLGVPPEDHARFGICRRYGRACRLLCRLLVAGHETTVSLLGNGFYTLLRHSEQLASVKQSPDLLTLRHRGDVAF